MIITIILLILIIASLIFIYYCEYGNEILGVVPMLLIFVYLSAHIYYWSTASYRYHVMIVERQSFIETLTVARNKEFMTIEVASITKDIVKWNKNLAVEKYNTTVFLLKDYTDKRVLNLEPIK